MPISSFYLEMRAASYMTGESSISWSVDVSRFFNCLYSGGLAAMNDPTGGSGRIEPCSSPTNHADAYSKLRTAAVRASNANDYVLSGNLRQAFEQWDLLWSGRFPSYG